MLARSTVIKISKDFIGELRKQGFAPKRAVLFGSYAKGVAHNDSDIDLAVWDDKFIGCLPADIELIIPAKKKFTSHLEVHTFHSDETKNSNPFIGEIERTGIAIPIQ